MTYLTDITSPEDASRARRELLAISEKHIDAICDARRLHLLYKHWEASCKTQEAEQLREDLIFLETLLVHWEQANTRSANA